VIVDRAGVIRSGSGRGRDRSGVVGERADVIAAVAGVIAERAGVIGPACGRGRDRSGVVGERVDVIAVVAGVVATVAGMRSAVVAMTSMVLDAELIGPGRTSVEADGFGRGRT
jgi:hypothetical protein